jgi:hypothetical protein
MVDIHVEIFRDLTPDPPNPISADLLLKPEFLEQYKKQRDRIADELRELNLAIFILEKLELFPFWLFTPDTHDYVFWRTVKFSLVQTVITIASRVIIDADAVHLTLRGFRNQILQHTIDETTRVLIVAKFRNVQFERRIARIEAKVRAIRNNFVAHLDNIENLQPPSARSVPTVTYAEMKELLTASLDLFDALCLDSLYSHWFVEYWEDIRHEERTDIDRLLLQVANSSILLHLPENRPIDWQYKRQRLSSDEISLLNKYRVKLGLPEVS